MEREPARLAGLVVGVVSALLALLVALGLPISGAAQEAILGVVAFAAPIAAGLWIRRHVTPVSDPRNDQGEKLVPTKVS